MDWMVLPYKRYFDFSGRSRRKEYWMFVLFNVIVYAVVGGTAFASRADVAIGKMPVSTVPEIPKGELAAFGLMGLFALFTIIPSIALHVRRFHDQNRSGWFYLLAIIPYLGGLIVFIFMCLDGTPGINRFGDDPKGRGLYGVFN